MKVDVYAESRDKDELLEEENGAGATGRGNLNGPGRIGFGENRSGRVWEDDRVLIREKATEVVVRERGEDEKTGDRGS